MKRISSLLIVSLTAVTPAVAQIAAWDFNGASFPVSCTATTFDLHLDTTGFSDHITRGPGAAASGGMHSFRTTGFQNDGISVAAGDYFQATLHALPGYKLSLTTLDAKFNGTPSFYASPGVASQFAYSLDGINFSLIGDAAQTPSLTLPQVGLEETEALQNVYSNTTVTLRYYASGQTSTGGWGFYSVYPGTNGFAIGGLVTPAADSAPAVQASGIVFGDIGQHTMSLYWTPGSGERRLLKINTAGSFTPPADGTDPSANPCYAGAGEQVIWKGAGSSVPLVTGLSIGVTYWFRIYEYNGMGNLTRFNTSPGNENPASQATSSVLLPPVVSSPFVTLITSGSATLGGRVFDDGGSPLTERGTVWSKLSPVTAGDHMLPEGGTDTGFFSHARTGLPPATKVYYAAIACNSVGTSLSEETSFFTLAEEPPGHATGFTATAAGIASVELTWNPVVPGADGYLVLRKTGVLPPAWVPSDATRYAPGDIAGDAVVAAVILPGTAGSAVVTGLSPGTAYAFSIFPFAWDGTDPPTINYFAGNPVPWDSAVTPIPPVTTYQWAGTGLNDWTLPQNWSPPRAIPSPNDILVFAGGGSWTITGVPGQTIGQLYVTAGTAIMLQGEGTLNIAGDSGTDLSVGSGCRLNISGPDAMSVSLAAGAAGSIMGEMTFTGGAHRLLAASAGGIVFGDGALFGTGSGFTGNPFGTVNLNSVVFAAGSVYAAGAGANPFGAAAPASVVVFRPGSLYRVDAYAIPSFSGRTYGDFEMNYAGSITVTGSGAVSIGNFTASRGTFYFNMTGAPGHSIMGNIKVARTATLIFSPASAGTVVLDGLAAQSVTGTGSLMAGPNSTISVVNATGVTLNMDARFNNLSISPSGRFIVAGSRALRVDGVLTVEAN